MYVRDVQVDDSWFPDHAALWATFDAFGSPPMLPLRRQVKPLPWHDIKEQYVAHPAQLSGDPTQQYQQLCAQVEADVATHLATQGKLCPKQCLGRATTREVRFVPEYTTPSRHACQGEPQPEFHGIDLQHAQWTRQCRRLHNLAKLVRRPQFNADQAAHCFGLWRKILTSPGFLPWFAHWWISNAPSDTPCLPDSPPSHDIASKIAAHFEFHLRMYEKALLYSRIRQAKQRRVDDPYAIYTDIKGPPPSPAQMLVQRAQATVIEVDVQDQALGVDPPQQWNPDQPVMVDGQALEVEKEMGDLPTVFAAFGAEWSKRWDKHAQLTLDHWDAVIRLIDNCLPPLPTMDLPMITPDLWRKTLQRKKKRAAVGPDSVTREDLLRLDDQHLEQLLAILQHTEQTGHWPLQLLDAFVIALEKQHGADQVTQFRPIVILSVCYRTWSSIRARQILEHLAPHAPATCLANLPGKSANQVWHKLMVDIELGQAQGSHHSGGVVDLVKAYNMLPRIPVLHVMRRLGVHDSILRAWGGALVGLARRFKIRSSCGPAIRSTTGFPEGCALSVTAMLGLNFLRHAFCQQVIPSCTLWTYVDNIELSGASANDIMVGMTGLSRFWCLLEVQIDANKSYCWSISGADRRELRQHDWLTKHWARDLGGHVQYSMQVTNSTITQRCQAVKPLWNRVARSLAPYKQKLRSLRVKAWPNCLHGCQSVHLADLHYQQLRTGALQALGEHKPGTSPLLHLGVVESPTHDPQCFALVHTAMMMRDMHAFHGWLHFCHADSPHSSSHNGTSTRSLLGVAGKAAPSSLAMDFRSRVPRPSAGSLWCPSLPHPRTPWKIMQGLASQGFATRKTMGSLQLMSPFLTTEALRQWPDEDQAMLRNCLNGTFFTNDRRKHQKQAQSTDCKFCQQPDSQMHRQWHCPHFQERRHIPPEHVPDLETLPQAITCHGFVPEPPAYIPFKQACAQLYNAPVDFLWPPQVPEHLHLVTDGTCQAPACSFTRLAAWGFVLAMPDLTTFWPVANGILPGWSHTVLRAEIRGAIQACLFALACQRPSTLSWIDNDLVFRRARRFMNRACWLKPNQKDADLWAFLYRCIRSLGSRLVDVVKVCSHQNSVDAQDEVEACFREIRLPTA